MLATLSTRVGRLVLLTLALAVITAVAVSFAPTIRGYDWIGPIRVLRTVSLRANFPSVVAVAWILGTATCVPQSETWRRLTALPRDLPKRLRDPWCWYGLVTGVFVAVIAHIANPPYTHLDIVAVTLLAGVVATKPKTTEQVSALLEETLRVAVLFISTSFVFTVIKAFLFVFTQPQDAAIVAFETGLFGRPVHHWVMEWVTVNPALTDFFDQIYYMLFEHMTVAFVFLGAAGLHVERAKLWSGLTICYLIGGPAYYLFPGVGPAFLEVERYAPIANRGLISRGMWEVLTANTNAMRAGQSIRLSPYDFIACMPSLHLAQETVMLYYARFSRPFFLLSLLFTVATSIAVMALGWHYFIDLFAGVALGAIAIAFVELVGPGLPTRAASAPAVRATKPHWMPLGIGIGVLVSMWPAWRNPFVFEDITRVLPFASFRSLRGLFRALTTIPISVTNPLESLRSYRPATTVVDWVACLFLDADPTRHHLLSLGLLALCAWLIYDVLRRLEVGATIRNCAVVAVVLHPVSVLTAGYVSARTWLLGGVVILLIVRSLLTRERHANAAALAFGGAMTLGLLHEGMTFIGMSLPLVVTPRTRRARTVAAIAAAGGCAVSGVVRGVALNAMPIDSAGEFLRHTGPGVLRVFRSLFTEASASPSLALTAGSDAVDLVVGAGLLTVFIGAYLAALTMARTPRARVVAMSGAFVVFSTLGVAVAASQQHGVTSAASIPALFGVVLAASIGVAHMQARARRAVSSLRRAAPVMPFVVFVAAAPLAWATLLSMGDAEEFARGLEASHPEDGRIALLHATAQLHAFRPAEGLASCERAARAIEIVETDFCIAAASAALGNFERAADLLVPTLPVLESDQEVRRLYVLALAESGKPDEALHQAKQWLVHYPNDRPLHELKDALEKKPEPAAGASSTEPG